MSRISIVAGLGEDNGVSQAARLRPAFLKVALWAIAGNTVFQVLMAMSHQVPSLMAVALLYCILLVGLVHGHRWAYLFWVVMVPIKIVVSLAEFRPQDVLVPILVLDFVGFLGVLMGSGYFWRRGATTRAVSATGWHAPICSSCQSVLDRPGRYCPTCGRPVAARA
jgi:hypothetical protein